MDPDQARATAADPHALGDAAASSEPAAEDDELSAAPRASA